MMRLRARQWRIGVFMLVCAGLAIATAAEPAGPWELIKERDGIRVYARSIQGSDYQEIRAETVANVGINQLLGLMDDTAACPRWMHNCLAPALLAKPSLEQRYTYLINDMPWPYGDRALIVHSLIEMESGRVTIRLRQIDESALPPEARTRLPRSGNLKQMHGFNGQWTFTPGNDGSQIVYTLHIDLGGSPSGSLANRGIADTAFYTLANMREIAADKKYRNFEAF